LTCRKIHYEEIDPSFRDLIRTINASGLKTVACCSGLACDHPSGFGLGGEIMFDVRTISEHQRNVMWNNTNGNDPVSFDFIIDNIYLPAKKIAMLKKIETSARKSGLHAYCFIANNPRIMLHPTIEAVVDLPETWSGECVDDAAILKRFTKFAKLLVE
jgi:hypothetical protein